MFNEAARHAMGTKRRAIHRKKFWWLDPPTLGNIAYTIHVANDPSTAPEVRAEAQKRIQRFDALTAAEESEDELYLYRVKNIVTSIARGITRRKDEYRDSLESAREQRDDALGRIREGRFIGVLFSYLWRLGAVAAIGGVGYNLMLTLSGFVPESISQKTGIEAPSYLVGFLFVVVGGMISFTYNNFRRDRIHNRFDRQKFAANRVYEEGKRREFETHKRELIRLYEEYTGSKYRDHGSYSEVIASDLRMLELLEAASREDKVSHIVAFARQILGLGRSKKNGPAAGPSSGEQPPKA